MNSIEGTAQVRRPVAPMGARAQRRAPWGAVALATVLAACGTSSTPAAHSAASVARGSVASASTASSSAAGGSAAGGSDPCRFVTPGEAGALLGGKVREPTRVKTPAVGNIAAAQACTYLTPGGASMQIVATTVTPAKFKPDKNALDAGAEKLRGVGDDAFVIAGHFSLIAVRVGTHSVLISPSVPGDAHDPTRAQLISLGKTAAGRF